MFCKNCGTDNLDTARFCVGCGTDLTAAPEQPVYEQPVYEQPVYEQPVYQEPEVPNQENADGNAFSQAFDKAADFGKNYMEEAKKDKKKLLIPIIAAAALTLTIVLLIVLFSSPYKSALNREIKYYEGKATEKTIEKSMPDEYWEYMDDEYDITPADRYDTYEEYYLDSSMDALEDEYGDNIRISYKIKEKDKLSDKKLGDLKDYYKECGMEKKSLTKAYKLELEITVKGSEDKETLDGEAIVFKYKGKWYVDEFNIDD